MNQLRHKHTNFKQILNLDYLSLRIFNIKIRLRPNYGFKK